MSCFFLQKKLKQLPSSSKKAWKSFTSTLSPKLRHLHNHGLNLTKTTTRCFLNLRQHKNHRKPPPPHGVRSTFCYCKQYNNNNYQHLQQPLYSFGEPNTSPATVYVDRLFGESYSPAKEVASTSGGDGGGASRNDSSGIVKKKKKVGHNNNNNRNNNNYYYKNNNGGNNNINNNRNNNWKEYVLSMPTIRGVDERAEEFISKFRQQIQIQREQSLIEFQEMLARTA